MLICLCAARLAGRMLKGSPAIDEEGGSAGQDTSVSFVAGLSVSTKTKS
jgi:hypothetical protein